MDFSSDQEFFELYHSLKRRNLTRMFARCYKFLTARAEILARENGFDDFRMHYMGFLANIGPEGATASEIARRIWVTKQAMSKLMAELRQKGYIHFIPHETDRRAQVIHLTEKGIGLLKCSISVSEQLKKEFEMLVGPENIETLLNMLEPAVAKMDNPEGFGPVK